MSTRLTSNATKKLPKESMSKYNPHYTEYSHAVNGCNGIRRNIGVHDLGCVSYQRKRQKELFHKTYQSEKSKKLVIRTIVVNIYQQKFSCARVFANYVNQK